MRIEPDLLRSLSDQQKKGLLTDRNWIVSAGAGAGKTSVLTARYLHLILNLDLNPSEILAVTFTRNGAEEMRNRILAELRTCPEIGDTKRFELLTGVARADILTFDALFLALYSEFGPGAGFPPAVSVPESADISRYLNELRSDFLRILNTGTQTGFWYGQTHADLLETGEFLAETDQLLQVIDQVLAFAKTHSDPDELFFLNSFASCGIPLCLAYSRITSALLSGEGPDFEKAVSHLTDFTGKLSGWALEPETGEADSSFWLKSIRLLLSQWEQIKNLTTDPESIRNLTDKQLSLVTVPGLSLQDEESALPVARFRLHFSRLASSFISGFGALKTARSQAGFQDIQAVVYQLIHQSPEQELAQQLSGRYRQVMIDEFQDTNQIQWEMLKPFVWDYHSDRLQQGKLFIVGDPKQSIFRFRNAQVSVFHEAGIQISRDNQLAGCPAREDLSEGEKTGHLNLTDNYRSCKSVLNWVNLIFDAEFCLSPDGRQIRKQVDYFPMTPAKTFSQDDPFFDGEVTLVNQTKKELIPALVADLAAHITQINLGKDPLFRLDNDKIAVIASKNASLDEISRFLRQRNIPHRRSRGLNLLQTAEGTDILNFVRFLADPEDDHAFTGVSKSPFLLLADETLFQLKLEGRKSFWKLISSGAGFDSLEPGEKSKLVIFRTLADTWLSAIMTGPVSPVIWQALSETGAWACYSSLVSRDQVLSNLSQIMEEIIRLEKTGGKTARDLADDLKLLRFEEEGLAEIPLFAGNSSVRIDLLTVHKAKGLTYKYVFVLDDFRTMVKAPSEIFCRDAVWGTAVKTLSAGADGSQKDTFWGAVVTKMKEEIQAEDNRQVYVALTRATHKLTFVSDFGLDENGQFSESGKLRNWGSRIGKNLPYFLSLEGVGFRQGQIEDSEYKTTPWQETEPSLKPDEAGDWLQILAENRPIIPESEAYFTNFTATGLLAARKCGTSNRLKKIQINRKRTPASQPDLSPAEKGTLVHLLLSKPESEWKELTELQHIPAALAESLKETAGQVLGHPLFQNLQKGVSFSEVPFIAVLEGRHLQGSIDRLVLLDNEAWIIDFKTNRLNGRSPDVLWDDYFLQLQIYSYAVRLLFPEIGKVHAVLFSTEAGRESVRTFTPEAVSSFSEEILPVLRLVENREYDRDYQTIAPYLCEECSFYSFCHSSVSEEKDSVSIHEF